MPVTRLSLGQFAAQVGKLPADMEQAIVRGLRSAAQRGVADVVASINAVGATDTGELARSVSAHNTMDGARIVVDAPHADVVERGARPFSPPIAPLQAWAMRKLGVTQARAREIAFAVQAKIRRQGIAPRFYFRSAMRTVQLRVPVEVERELRKL